MSNNEMTSPDGGSHLSYNQMVAANEQLIEKYGEEYRDKIGGKYTHSDGTHCYVGALFEELGYPLPKAGKDYANGSSVGGIKSWLEKEHNVTMNSNLQKALQMAQVKNDRKETWGSAADAFMQSYRKSHAEVQLRAQKVNKISMESNPSNVFNGSTNVTKEKSVGQKIWED
jgi:hypothetical protein